MPLETIPFDAAQYLGGADDQKDLLADALESGDPAFIKHALNTIARARGMSAVAREAGVTREGLYKALSPQGDPQFSTIIGVMKALGMVLTVKEAAAA